MKSCNITSCAYYDCCWSEEDRENHKCDEPMEDIEE